MEIMQIDPTWAMAIVMVVAVVAIVLYAIDRIAMEMVSLGVIAFLLVFFALFPLMGTDGRPALSAQTLLQGYASPALFAVLSLLVIGQGMVHNGSLDKLGQALSSLGRVNASIMIMVVLAFVLACSSFLNNTPVVIIFIPIMQALVTRLDASASRVMMPLSFAAILGGMVTLIGSSTNLLVSDQLVQLGLRPLGFFEFTVPGLCLAGVGLLYIILIAPYILPDRASLTHSLISESGRQFIAQITILKGSKLIGAEATAGFFPVLEDVHVRFILRREHAHTPPFDGFKLKAGDILVVAATRKALTSIIAEGAAVVGADYSTKNVPKAIEEGADARVLSEVMVTPASRLIGLNLERIGFRYRFNSVVLGLQRRSRMIKAAMTEIPLEAGDILLVQGSQQDIQDLRMSRDLLPIEHSLSEIPVPGMARRAMLIFALTISVAATEIVPVAVAAMTGAAATLFTGVLNIRQAFRAVDRNLILLVGSSLALGVSLQATGAAHFLADELIQAFSWAGPVALLSVFFLLVAVMTNVISNNACAVIFTPIAINLAHGTGVDPIVYAVTVIFAANCSFVTPIGYQTNLLVMGPGHYRFSDFFTVGAPLMLLIWITFTLLAPWYYGL